MSKEFAFNQEAREKILRGVNTLARVVSATLGPKGRTVLIQKPHGIHSTKDGVSCAREVVLEDAFENMGAQLVKQSSEKTATVAGDGTTTATVLAQKLIEEGFKLVAAGHAPIDLQRGMDLAVNHLVEELKTFSKPITSSKEIEQVGTISANGDVEVGKLIARAMDEVGNDGVISLEEGKGINTELSVAQGYHFDKGYISSHFATNEKLEAVLENPLVLLTDRSIDNVSVIIPIMEKIHKDPNFSGRPLLLVAKNVEGDALPTLVLNHLKNAFKSCCVKNPGFGDRAAEMMQDIAVLTGATVISETVGLKLESFDVSQLGMARRVIVKSDSTTIVEGTGDVADIEARVQQVRAKIEAADSDWDREKQEERLAKLVGGVAVISVGAPTEAAMKEKKDRVEDALAATKAAVSEGIVPGGGVALVRVAKSLDNLVVPAAYQYGVDLVRLAVKEPLRKIVLNAGFEPAEIMIGVLGNDNPNWGFNAATGNYEDLVEGGIVDPTLVIRACLQNSCSVAITALTTECLICEKKKNENIGGGGY
jgi:chaperonin GroEL